MPTLFKALLSQHARTLKPMRYAEAMTAQLQNFFEEVVLENHLEALVVESLPFRPTRSMREIERIRRLSGTARFPYFLVSPEDDLASWYRSSRMIAPGRMPDNLVVLPRSLHDEASDERFLVIADTHFSALLTAVNFSSEDPDAGHQVIYSFDPDVVYTALEYLGARFMLEHRQQSAGFMEAVHRSMPKSTSLHLTLAVTTKLATLWQEQTGREIAVNRIATEIRQSLELDQILQTAVNEVGQALGIKCCALLIESEDDEALSIVYFREELPEDVCALVRADLEAYKRKLRNYRQNYVRDGFSASTGGWGEQPQVIVPLSFLGNFVGVLYVQAEDMNRIWKESEILLLQTVADQVAVAVKHSRLYVKSQQEALRDSLTGVFNRRFFEMQFEREFKLAQRKNSTFALLMVDFDNFKKINDEYSHLVGDCVLRRAADALRNSLRAFDTLARYGGEEFVVILPQVSEDDAYLVGERLRHKIEDLEIPDVPRVTVSIGIAVYPYSSTNMTDLMKTADKALYRAKREGRNRVCLANSLDIVESEEERDPLDESFISVSF